MYVIQSCSESRGPESRGPVPRWGGGALFFSFLSFNWRGIEFTRCVIQRSFSEAARVCGLEGDGPCSMIACLAILYRSLLHLPPPPTDLGNPGSPCSISIHLLMITAKFDEPIAGHCYCFLSLHSSVVGSRYILWFRRVIWFIVRKRKTGQHKHRWEQWVKKTISWIKIRIDILCIYFEQLTIFTLLLGLSESFVTRIPYNFRQDGRRQNGGYLVIAFSKCMDKCDNKQGLTLTIAKIFPVIIIIMAMHVTQPTGCEPEDAFVMARRSASICV